MVRDIRLYQALSCSAVMVLFLIFVFFSFTPKQSAQADTTTSSCGLVFDETGNPVSGAVVRFQASAISTLTNPAGEFCLQSENAHTAITAWKEGYYIGGLELSDPVNNGLTIHLRLLPESQADYRWLHSTMAPGSTPNSELEPCSQCHERLTEEWSSSAHGQSHENPIFDQVLSFASSDFGGAAQQCRLCHQPQHQSKAIECDFCHKISGVFGLDSQRLGRERIEHHASEDPPVFFGSLDDVFSRDDSFNPLYKSSEYCATCHQGNFWNTQAYSVYSEWQQSRYQREQIQCQDCHMSTAENYSADRDKGGIWRESSSLSSHDFLLKGKSELLASAIDMQVSLETDNDVLKVVVELSNNNAGHHVPTGSPLRSLLLLVTAEDQSGELTLSAGDRIANWAGESWQGKTGKGFAKILSEVPNYRGEREQHFEPLYPAPFWRPTIVESDNRIAAGASDRSEYSFDTTDTETFNVSVQLLYFEYFADWLPLPPPEPVKLSAYDFSGKL